MPRYCKIKYGISLVLIIAMLVGIYSSPATALTTDTYNFANFSETDSMAFVEDCNIDIPTKLLQSEKLASFTHDIVLQSYIAPDIPFSFSYDKTQQYAEDIRLAVKSHTDLGGALSVASAASYVLQYNKVKNSAGNWVTSGGAYDDKWLNYNCYAYSINRTEQPNFYSSDKQYQPGDMCGKKTFAECEDVNELAELIKDDLTEMGYSNISLTSSIPSVNSSQELICVRMSYADYHFMRYDLETNAWYHKPGNTAVLKYNFVPSNGNLWYREFSFRGTESYAATPYDSNIVFIRYSKNKLDVSQSSSSRAYIQSGKDVFYEIVFANSGYYKIQLNSSYSFEYELYSIDFDIISSNKGTASVLYMPATTGKYYLRMNFVTNKTLNYVDIQIEQHTHSYDTYTSNGSSGHAATCSECGYFATLSHTYTYTYTSSNLFTHTAHCSKCSYRCSESHTWYSSPTNYRCTKCRLVTVAIPVLSADLPPALLLSLQQLGTDAAIAMDENTFLCQVDGQYYMVKGTTAEQALQTVLPQVNEAA